jgi:hypothetical protein
MLFKVFVAVLPSAVWRHAVWPDKTNVLKEPPSSVFYSEDRGSRFSKMLLLLYHITWHHISEAKCTWLCAYTGCMLHGHTIEPAVSCWLII